MEAGTIIIGLLCQALGTILVMLTASILLYLIIRGFWELCYWLHLRRIGKIYKQIDAEMDCGECGRPADVKIDLTPNVVDYPLCDDCLQGPIREKYKSDWANSQIIIKPLEA
jgi:hypothetical protein